GSPWSRGRCSARTSGEFQVSSSKLSPTWNLKLGTSKRRVSRHRILPQGHEQAGGDEVRGRPGIAAVTVRSQPPVQYTIPAPSRRGPATADFQDCPGPPRRLGGNVRSALADDE